MIITVNTDASFSKKYQIGSYAFWIVSNRFKILKSGLLKQKIERAEIAEFMCIINAMHVLSKNDLSDVRKIIINTDCLNVIHLINNDVHEINRYKLRDFGKKYVKIFKTTTINFPKIELRHVKAHTSNSDARSYVNNWCDTEAKKWIKIKINEHENCN